MPTLKTGGYIIFTAFKAAKNARVGGAFCIDTCARCANAYAIT